MFNIYSNILKILKLPVYFRFKLDFESQLFNMGSIFDPTVSNGNTLSLPHNNFPPICTWRGLHVAAQQMDSALTEVCTVNSRYHLHQQAVGHA